MKNTYRFLESDWTERSFQIQDEIRQQVGWVDLSVEQTLDGYTDVCFSCPDPEEGKTDPVEAMATLVVESVEEEKPAGEKEELDSKGVAINALKASIPTRLTVADKQIPMMLKAGLEKK